MPEEFTVTGGARIGWWNVTWPGARLRASPECLELFAFFRCYRFTRKQVLALEPCEFLPFVGRGVRIRHAHPDYPPKIVFWCFGNPGRLIERVRATWLAP